MTSHWSHLIAPTGGSLIPRDNQARWIMDDGREYTLDEIQAHRNNAHGVSATTLRHRLKNGRRDLGGIFQKRMPRPPEPKRNQRVKGTPFNCTGQPL